MTTISFSVVGIPVGQGSKRAFVHKGTGKAVMTEGVNAAAAKRHKSWRAELADAAAAVAPPEPFAGPVTVTLRFRFLPTTGDPYRTFHATSPDIDKLARSVLDALTVARVMVDDSRVCWLEASKTYCTGVQMPGVDIRVADFSGHEAGYREMKKVAAATARKKASA